MEKAIEEIWKEGFVENDLTIKIDPFNLYNQKSKHLVERHKRMFKNHLTAILVMAVVFWVFHYFLDAIWQGTCISLLLLGLAYYSKQQLQQMNSLNPGLNSYEYLTSFDKYLKDAISRHMKIMKVFYPLIFLTAMSTIWFADNNQVTLTNKLTEKFPDMIFIGGLPLIGVVLVGIITLLIAYFADRIYKWDLGLMYGRIFKKLEATIAEMEELKA